MIIRDICDIIDLDKPSGGDIVKKTKRLAIISLLVCAGLILNVALAYFALLIFSMEEVHEPVYHMLSPDKVNQYLLYDHIEYNGEDYYFAESADNIIPDFSEEAEVVIADSNCKAYGDGKTYTAYFCQNDEEHSYIYYGSAYFVNDPDLAYTYSDEEMEDWLDGIYE